MSPLRSYRLAVIGFSPSSGAPRRGLVPLDGGADTLNTSALGPAAALALDAAPLGTRFHLTITPPTPAEQEAAEQEAAQRFYGLEAQAPSFLAALEKAASLSNSKNLCQVCYNEPPVTRTQLLRADGSLTPSQVPCCAYCIAAFLGGPADGKTPWAVSQQISALVRDLRPTP